MPEPKIIQRKDKRKDGTSLLYIQLYFQREPLRINLGIKVLPEQFDAQKERVKGNHPNAADLNLLIRRQLARVNEILIRFRLTGELLTVKSFKRVYHNPSGSEDFIQFWESEMYLQFQRGIFTEVTLVRHKRNLKRIKEFTQEHLKQDMLFFSQISPAMMAQFDLWLMRLLKENGVKNGRPERQKMQKSIKKFLRAAKIAKKEFENPFPDGSQIKYRTPERIWLSKEELGRMLDLFRNASKNPFLTQRMRIVLRGYLVQCFSGLRFSDTKLTAFEALQKDYIKILPKKTEQSADWIKVHMNAPLKVLLSDENLMKDRQYVIDRQKLPYVPLIPTLAEPTSNKMLKVLARMARIQKRISTHTGRHTFATLFLEAGGSIEVLQKLLGHKNIKATIVYVHLADRRPGEEVRGAFDGFG